jgi:hypothetical protein
MARIASVIVRGWFAGHMVFDFVCILAVST